MTVDEPIDDVGRKGKKSRAGVMSVAERLQSNVQLSPNSQGEPDQMESEQRTPLQFGQYDKATIRVIAQFLDNIGLKSSVEALVEETGFHIETSSGARIRANILKGNYDAACDILKQSQDLDHETSQHASYMIQCFKLADLVRKGRYLDALYTMQSMTPYVFPDESKNLEYFDSFVKDVLLGGARYQHVDAATERNSQLAFLEELLPSDFILPQNRLKSVLTKMHGAPSDDKSLQLLRDETSSNTKTQPFRCLQVWDHQVLHKTPIYHVKFSRSGKLLVSGGKSNAIILWKAREGRIVRVGDFSPIPEGDIHYMEFCQRDRFVAVCGGPQCKFNLTVFDVQSRLAYRTLRVHQGHDNQIDIGSFYTCCSFLTDRERTMIVGGNELGALKVYNLMASENMPAVKQVTGFRVRAIYGMKDGNRFLTVDAHHRVRQYSVMSADMQGTTICKEEVPIVNMVVHPSEKLILTTTLCNLRLWDIKTRNLVRVFSGACQSEEFTRYSIHACFGGVHQNFVATGSIGRETDDSLLYNNPSLRKNGRVVIWSVDESRPRYTLVGHKGHVNAVTWNPLDPTMIVSCGDDGTVRVWSLDRSETSDVSEVIPRMITRREKYGRANEPGPSTSKNGHCETTTRTTEMIRNLRLIKTEPDEKFVPDLQQELQWIRSSERPDWMTDVVD